MEDKAVTAEPNKLQCPGCGADLCLTATAAWAPEIMSVSYKLQPGRKMGVEEFCESLKALAKLLKASAKELGANVSVGLEALSVADSEVTASVSVVMIDGKGKG